MSVIIDQLAPQLDHSQYPTTWARYIGQEPAKRMLQVAAKSAKMRRVPLDHVLISHPSPGIGKTALASLIAKELGRTCRVVSGQLGPNGARMLFSDMSDGDAVFYDEFHQVMDKGKKRAEWMLTYLQDCTLPGPRGMEKQPKVTIIAATTDAAKILPSITGRFPLKPPLQEYSPEEAAKIAQVLSAQVLTGLPKLGKSEAISIALAGGNNPRAIRSLLTVLRDMTVTQTIPLVRGRYDIDALLEWQGITSDGLDRTAREYLRVLAVEFQGTAGVNALEDRLQQPGGLGETERVLMNKGYLAKTRSGRVLTQSGISRVRALIA